jgi:hypothetical protein
MAPIATSIYPSPILIEQAERPRPRPNLFMPRKQTHPASRRHFLKRVGALAIVSSLSHRKAFSATNAAPSSILKNRAPLTNNAFYLLPLGSVRPTGWLRAQLEIQANGLGGHLDETWPDVGPNSGWLGGTGESWERGPYFLDGLVPLAYLLDDPRLKAKAQKFIAWTLTNQQPNGMIGPKSNDDWWPRMVMLKVLTQYQEATADPRVIPLLSRYFAYQLQTLPTHPLKDWAKFRWQDNVLSVLWLYNRTGDPALLDLARLLHAQGFDWQKDFADFKFTERMTAERLHLPEGGLSDLALATHGVNNGQAVKAAPVWSLLTNNPADRAAIHQMLSALDTYHGLPNGMFSCDEHLAGRNPSQGSELCTVVETMFSLEQSLAIVGDPSLGDRLERIAFNALPGAFTDDMWAHQYNQEPNQVECSLHHKPWTTDGPESNLYGLEPNFGCCTANFHQGWPKFTASLWMASPDDGLVAAAYSPCNLTTTVRNTPVTIHEETDYPFRGTIRLTIDPSSPLAFPLNLRIPAWATDAAIRINGKPRPNPAPNTFVRIHRTWKSGDVVELTLPLVPRITRGFNQSVSVDRGPLVFSYPIGEDWLKLRDRGMTADWQVFPSAQWNYALAGDEANPTTLHTHELPMSSAPFTHRGSPIEITTTARRVPSWQAVDGAANPVPPSPLITTEPDEIIRLIPYAAAKLRITSFPQYASPAST